MTFKVREGETILSNHSGNLAASAVAGRWPFPPPSMALSVAGRAYEVFRGSLRRLAPSVLRGLGFPSEPSNALAG